MTDWPIRRVTASELLRRVRSEGGYVAVADDAPASDHQAIQPTQRRKRTRPSLGLAALAVAIGWCVLFLAYIWFRLMHL